MAHSYYTSFPTEVKNCIAGLAGRGGDREADSEEMKKKVSEDDTRIDEKHTEPFRQPTVMIMEREENKKISE